MFDSLLHDVRYAGRLLRRNPLFTLTAALSLAIGIGANTAIFTIANALLFRPPAGVVDPGRVVDIGRSRNGRDFDTNSYPNYLDIRSRATALEGVYAYTIEPRPMSLGGRDGAERIYGTLVSGNYFTTLGTTSHAGRLIAPEDEARTTAVVVFSHRFWTRHFNADLALVGEIVILNGHPFVVAGIAEAGFQGTTILTPDAWVPLTTWGQSMPRLERAAGPGILGSRASTWLHMGGRLKRGVPLATAQAELDTIGRALEHEFPDENRGWGLRVLASAPIPGNPAPIVAFMALLMVLVGLVLVVASVNVAGVLLARATARRREIAVRLAMGAGRARLVRQMLIETTALFLLGAGAGLLVARVMTTLLVSMLPTLLVQVQLSLALDGRAVAFTVALTLAAAILSGLAPAFQASRAELGSSLKSDAQGGPERMRLRNAFVVSQVAFSMVLVVAAGLLVRALRQAGDVSPGFDVRGVEVAQLDLSLAGYTTETGRAFTRDLVRRVREIRGVQSATLSAVLPLAGSRQSQGEVTVPGVTPPNGRRSLDADWNVIETGYFATLKTPIVRGRDFTDDDREGTERVVIVNETAAREWWPGQDAIGNVLVQDNRRGAPDSRRALTVVGVARDAKYFSYGEAPTPFVFVPEQQQYTSRIAIVARSTQGQRLAVEIRKVIVSLNPNLPIVQSQTLEDYASIGLLPQRVAASVSGSLGIVGLLLAAIGIYGVAAYMVTSRTREIGIRMALGARPRDVVRMVLKQGMTLALIGVAIGLALAAGVSRLLGALLFGVGTTDPITFAGSAALFCLIGLAACYAPARRATEIEATEALRYE